MHRPPRPSHLRFLALTAALVGLGLASTAAALFCAARDDRLAPLPVTGSLLFDEKLEQLRRKGRLDFRVLALGSSMTLNNLNSASLVERLGPDRSYYNAAAWGMKVSDTRSMLEYLLARSQPEVVIVVSGPMDFYGDASAERVLPERFDEVLGGTPYPLLVARYFDLFYYLSEAQRLRLLRTRRDDFDSVALDAWGGVPLDLRYPNVPTERWAQRAEAEGFSEAAYADLEAMAAKLRRQGIGFVCAQSPLRRPALAGAESRLARHWQRVAEILARHGFDFYNLHRSLELDDSEFADYSHLNAQGARRFTDALVLAAASELTIRKTPKDAPEP